MLGQALVEFHIESHLLLVLLEDITGQEHVQGVVDASTKVLDSLTVGFILFEIILVVSHACLKLTVGTPFLCLIV